MFTTGSKFFYGAAALAAVAALVYGLSSGNPVFTGTITLVAFAVAAGFLGGIMSAFRDGHRPLAAGPEGLVTVHRAAPYSVWPILTAASAAVTVLGLALDRWAFILGLAALGVVAMEWAVQGWADGASDDPAYNRSVRNRFMHSIEFPVVGALVFGFVAFLFSQVMLALHQAEAVITFMGLGAVILAIAVLLSMKPDLARKAVPVLAVVGAVGLLAAGIVSMASGHVKHESKEVSGKAVALKSSVEATIRISGGKLNRNELVLPKGAYYNILFRNEDNGERQIVFVGQRSRKEGTQTVVEQFTTESEVLKEEKVGLVTLRIPKSGDYEFYVQDETGAKVATGKVVVP